MSKHTEQGLAEQKRGGRGTMPSWFMTDNAKEKLKKKVTKSKIYISSNQYGKATTDEGLKVASSVLANVFVCVCTCRDGVRLIHSNS